jgi:hypothetical protein
MASRTTLLETIANRFLARREELAEEMTERIRAGVAEFAGFDGPELPANVAKKRRVRLNSLRAEVRNA